MDKFIADVHLGKVARYLRLLGFDTVYKNSYTKYELRSIARSENRTLLTKNLLFLKDTNLHCCIITTDDSLLQLRQVVNEYQLKESFQPFSRCRVCNDILETVAKETIENKIEENTSRYYHEFWQCAGCKRVYWKGAHYKRMMRLIEEAEN